MSPSMWLNILLYVGLIGNFGVEGARRIHVEKRLAEMMDHYSSVYMRRDSESDEPTPDQMLGLKEGEHLEEGTRVVTAKGTIKIKLEETYNGIRVVGEAVVVEQDIHGRLTGHASGQLLEGLADDLGEANPTLSPEDVFQKALEHQHHREDNVMDKRVELKIYIPDTDYDGDDEVTPMLVYLVSYLWTRGRFVSNPSMLIDANTGVVYREWEGLPSWRPDRLGHLVELTGIGGNEKAGIHFYGKDLPKLQLWRDGDTCYLENDKVKVINLNQQWGDHPNNTEPANETFSFNCDTGFDDSVNGAYSPLTDTFFFATAVYDMYTRWYDMEPLTHKIVARVHEGVGYENAYWWNGKITFGDGNTTFYPLTNLDIISHEVSHGVTEQNSGLIYSGQSGGINEAFSDMAGVAATEFLYHNPDWIIGIKTFKEEGKGLRYMEDPTLDGRSIGEYEDFCPGIDVHLSSGVFNRAFYLLSNKPNWNVRKAFEIMVLANRIYWTPNSVYGDAACGAMMAASDLGYDPEDVREVFNTVGVQACVRNRNRLDTLHNIRARAGQEVQFVFELENREEQVVFEVAGGYGMQSENPLDLHVKSFRHRTSSTNNGSSERIAIDYPLPSPYVVTIEALDDFMGASLSATTAEVSLATNLTLSLIESPDSDDEFYGYQFQFYFSDDIAVGSSAAIRINNAYAAARFNESVDFLNRVYDYRSSWISENTTQVLICQVKEGPYHLFVYTYYPPQGLIIDVSYVKLLIPTRVIFPRQQRKE